MASLIVVLLLSLVMCLWALNISVFMATNAGKKSGAGACDQQSNRDPNIALFATSDDTVHCMDKDVRRVTWSFASGPSLYSSYQAPSSSYFIDLGDDWELYAHSESFGKKDFVEITPLTLADGSIILGSLKSTAFDVHALTARLLCTYSSFDSPSSRIGCSKTVSAGSLTITRTEYELQSFAQNSSKIMWNLRVAKIAALICQFDGEPGDMPSSCHWRVSVL